jgi:hypothetical protein
MIILIEVLRVKKNSNSRRQSLLLHVVLLFIGGMSKDDKNGYLLNVGNYQYHDRFDRVIDQVHRRILHLLMYYVVLP